TSIQKFLKGVPLPELHLSLNNRSKINHMIATKCRAEHPYGQDIIGIAYMLLKQNQKNEIDPYIRTVRKYELQTCTWTNQRIGGVCLTLVFAHAFTILQMANTYKKLFEELFMYVEQDCGHSIEFQHIHGCGI
ncbi:32336_t:CDS:2, partial [Racocetra persica]